MSESIDRVFVKAISTIRALSTRNSNNTLPRPPLANRVKLYGLYKQATEGDVLGIGSRPVGTSPEIESSKRKWDAWEQEKGLSKEEAKVKYIEFLIETLKNYAIVDDHDGTDETKEMLNELEYLWDQVKNSEDFNYSFSYNNFNPNEYHNNNSSYVGYGLTSNDLIQRAQSPALSLYKLASSNSNNNLLRPISRLSMTHNYPSVHQNPHSHQQQSQHPNRSGDLESSRTSLFNHDANVSHSKDSRRQFSNASTINGNLDFIKWQSDVNSTLSKLNTELSYMRSQRLKGTSGMNNPSNVSNRNGSRSSNIYHNTPHSNDKSNRNSNILIRIKNLIVNLIKSTFYFVKTMFKHITIDVALIYITLGLLKKILNIDLIQTFQKYKSQTGTGSVSNGDTTTAVTTIMPINSHSSMNNYESSKAMLLNVLKATDIIYNLIKLFMVKSGSSLMNLTSNSPSAASPAILST